MPGRHVRLPNVTRRVWVDAWQLQCCGDPIHVGRDVTLTVSPNVDLDYLGTVLGEERASTLTDYEDHHDVEAPVAELLGVVESVEAVSCEFSLQGRALYPVAGTSVVEHRERADGWEPETEVVRFLGYVVTITESSPEDRHPGSR